MSDKGCLCLQQVWNMMKICTITAVMLLLNKKSESAVTKFKKCMSLVVKDGRSTHNTPLLQVSGVTRWQDCLLLCGNEESCATFNHR